MSIDATVTMWIHGMKQGDGEAVNELWKRYFDRIVGLARKFMDQRAKAAADEEDVALSVFKSLCIGAANGKFEEMHRRSDLWLLLFAMTKRKLVDYLRRETRKKRGAGKIQHESSLNTGLADDIDFAFLDQLVSDEPTPEDLVSVNEEFQRLLKKLNDETLKKIAVWKMEGDTNDEIASKLDVTEKTIRRKVIIIKQKWILDKPGESNDD